MPRQKRDDKPKPLPTIWRVSDDLWAKIEPVLAERDPPKDTGRPRIDPRRALDGIIYRLRSGVQWNQLPQEFGDDSSVHRTFQRWVERGGVGAALGRAGRGLCRTGRGGLGMASGRCSDGQGPFGGDLVGANPTDRGKRG